MKLCVIPARGGSKRIPKKNIKIFCGKPIIQWSIEAALESNCFDRVIVSTDSEEISTISKALGAEVPFIRPSNLSDDFTATAPVINHAIQYMSQNFQSVELACCIYATAPFIEANYIQDGLRKIIENEANFSFSVTTFPFPIQRAIKLNKENKSEMFFPENLNKRSQDLEDSYHDAGQFYWGKSSAWLEGKRMFEDNSIPIIIPRHKVQDIDNEEDWIRAEIMFKAIQQFR